MTKAKRLELVHHLALAKIAGRHSTQSSRSICSDQMNGVTLSACIDLVGMGLVTEFFGKDGIACFCLPSGGSPRRRTEEMLPGLPLA
jgi:hypothetical protein